MSLTRRDWLAAGAAAMTAPAAWAQGSNAGTRFSSTRFGIVVRATINGFSAQALLDSGATAHTIDTGLAQRIGLAATSRPVTSLGVGGLARGFFSKPAELAFAGRQFPYTSLAMLDLSRLTERNGQPVELLLGRPLFDALVVDINFAAGSVSLHDRSAYAPPREATKIDLSPLNGLLTVPVTLPGGVIYASLDTGSMAPLVVSSRAARRIDLLGDGRISTTLMGGLSGVSEARITSVPNLTFGGTEFHDAPIRVPPRPIGTDGIVGIELLSRFNVALDFRTQKMWATPNGPERPFNRDLLGLLGEPGPEGLRITHVAAGSPVDVAGLKAGDVITRINGQPARSVTVRIVRAQPGFRVTFDLADGSRKQAVLARYY